MRARAPQALRLLWLRSSDSSVAGRVMQEAQDTLAIVGPEAVGAGKGARHEARTRLRLERVEYAAAQRVRVLQQHMRGGFELRRLRWPPSVHGTLARGDLEALFLIGRASRRANLLLVLIA